MMRRGLDRRSTALGVAAALALTAAALAPHAIAQQAPANGGGPLGAGNGPIDISADELEVLDAESRAIWRGNVEAVQGNRRLRAPVLNIFYAQRGSGGQSVPGASGGEIRRMEAEGPVYFVTPEQNARGDRAVYEAGSNSVTMTGNVVLVQGRNVVQGERLVIDTKTNKATMVGQATGLNQPRRVRGIFYPSQSNQAGGAPGAAARP